MGFTEGDGCFAVDYETDRVTFIITQKEVEVLNKIRTTLGYGKVYKSADGYYRYIVTGREKVGYLIGIFKGRLVFTKTKNRYKQ